MARPRWRPELLLPSNGVVGRYQAPLPGFLHPHIREAIVIIVRLPFRLSTFVVRTCQYGSVSVQPDFEV